MAAAILHCLSMRSPKTGWDLFSCPLHPQMGGWNAQERSLYPSTSFLPPTLYLLHTYFGSIRSVQIDSNYLNNLFIQLGLLQGAESWLPHTYLRLTALPHHHHKSRQASLFAFVPRRNLGGGRTKLLRLSVSLSLSVSLHGGTGSSLHDCCMDCTHCTPSHLTTTHTHLAHPKKEKISSSKHSSGEGGGPCLHCFWHF